MDVGKLSMNLSAINTTRDFGVAMLSKQLDTNEQMGKSLVSMMDKSPIKQFVTPHIGSNFDVSA